MLIPASNLRKYCYTGILVLALLVTGTTPGMAFEEFSQSWGGRCNQGL
jgi:hypothetical protein